jgi:hypothetical protein
MYHVIPFFWGLHPFKYLLCEQTPSSCRYLQFSSHLTSSYIFFINLLQCHICFQSLVQFEIIFKFSSFFSSALLAWFQHSISGSPLVCHYLSQPHHFVNILKIWSVLYPELNSSVNPEKLFSKSLPDLVTHYCKVCFSILELTANISSLYFLAHHIHQCYNSFILFHYTELMFNIRYRCLTLMCILGLHSCHQLNFYNLLPVIVNSLFS